MSITYLSGPDGVNFEMLRADLIADDFHNGRTTHQLELSFRNSQVQVYALVDNRCIGTARALSDGVGNAYVVDVWTQSTYRGQGIAREMMEKIAAACPGQHIYLQADDAVPFYEKLGYRARPVGMEYVAGEYLVNDTRQDQ